MLANSSGNFETLITQLLIEGRYIQAMKKGLELYQIKQFKIDSLPPNKIAEMYHVITTKFYFPKPSEPNTPWHENQLRVFIYLLIGYAFLNARCIGSFKQADWNFFSAIFNMKDPAILEFQGLSILKRDSKVNKWDFEEVSLLDSIIRSKSIKNKWNEIARELFIRSGKTCFKTSKQCREYWINHLDPTPVRSCWTISEDYDLVVAVKQVGKKWAKVSKMLGGRRTEHMVKNRFKSLYHFESKQSMYSQKCQKVEDEIIMTMIKKFSVSREEDAKLTLLEKAFKENMNSGYFDSEKVYDSSEEYESLDNLKEQGFMKKQSIQTKAQGEKSECEQGAYKTSLSFDRLNGITIQECISAFFDHDSFMAMPE